MFTVTLKHGEYSHLNFREKDTGTEKLSNLPQIEELRFQLVRLASNPAPYLCYPGSFKEI